MENDCLLGWEKLFLSSFDSQSSRIYREWPPAYVSPDVHHLDWRLCGCPHLARLPYVYIYRHFSLLMQHEKSWFHNTMWYSSHTHARVHMCQTAAGTAMCTNMPLSSLNLHAQEPGATASLCETLELYKKKQQLCVFILPFRSTHYPHHFPCLCLPSNLRWSHLWVTWFISLGSQASRHAATMHVTSSFCGAFCCASASCREIVGESL